MVVDGALTLDEAYKETVVSLRNLGWKDLELDSKIRGINANFEGERYGTPRVLRESGFNWKFISHSAEVGIAYLVKGEE